MQQAPKLTELELDAIEATAGTQVRVALDKARIKEYADFMLQGQFFPPMTVFNPPGSLHYYLADGFHRLEAAKSVGYETFPCEMYAGTLRDALQYALGANHDHGLPRTQQDRRNAIALALKDPEWSKWSNAQIARLCHVDDKTVAKVRKELNIPAPDKVKTAQLDGEGKVVEQKSKKARKSAPIDSGNRKELLTAIATIKAMPFSGAEAVERLGLESLGEDLAYCRDWFTEATGG
jgi:uncharacterized ParB-like nuclease family protein